MSASDKPLALHEFTFNSGAYSLQVECRRLPQEVARVTQTLQLDVEELFANLLDWDTPPAPAGGGGDPAEQPALPNEQLPDSKKLCGNVASDQPDLIGLDVWPAAIALCEYLARRPQLVAGAAVCELGAGMGLPGLLCAALGAASVLLTDYEPVVVEALRRNAELNGVARVCSFLSLDWLDLSPLAPAQRGAQDLLLLADVIYAAAVVRPLVATLRALLRPQSGAALVAHRIRRPLVFDRVDKIARLQERDDIFEEFKAACRAEGLHLRFLNDGPAAQAGDDPLLLAVGPDPDALRQRFPEAAAAAAEAEEAAGGGRAGGGQQALEGGGSDVEQGGTSSSSWAATLLTECQK